MCSSLLLFILKVSLLTATFKRQAKDIVKTEKKLNNYLIEFHLQKSNFEFKCTKRFQIKG